MTVAAAHSSVVHLALYERSVDVDLFKNLVVLRRRPHAPVHFGTRGLVEANLGIDHTDGFEHARDAEGGELTRERRLYPGV